MLSAPREEVARGLVTTSTGNMAQGVAWMARQLGVPATIVAPHNAAATKLAAVERLGGRIVRVSWDEWWAAMEAGHVEDVEGLFIHPVQDDAVMAGNGTAGLELVEDLEDFDAVLIPWGGGGLSTGIASAVKALRPDVRIYVCEPETGAPVDRSDGKWARAREGRLHRVLHRRGGVRCATPEDVGARRAARDRRIRDLARGRGRSGADARRNAHAWWVRAQLGCRSLRRSLGASMRSAWSASSRAGTSTRPASRRSSTDASRTSRPGSARGVEPGNCSARSARTSASSTTTSASHSGTAGTYPAAERMNSRAHRLGHRAPPHRHRRPGLRVPLANRHAARGRERDPRALVRPARLDHGRRAKPPHRARLARRRVPARDGLATARAGADLRVLGPRGVPHPGRGVAALPSRG